ncbi:YhgE/Pip domain-containing protein [Intrasporangium mesophilum]
MSPVRLAVAELRRLTSSRLARLGLIALVVIPTLYGGLYLYANHDPYGALSQVPAAVVSDDTGATLESGGRLDAGAGVADHLVDSKTFDWHQVSRDEALAGVHDGRYSFAVLLPATFSADLAATGDLEPRKATVVLETNDANNYMTSIMGNTVIKEVRASVASQVSQTAADRMLLGFSDIHDQLGKAVDGAEQVRSGLASADAGAAKASSGAHQLAAGLQDLAAGATQLHSGIAQASVGAGRLHDGATTLASGLATLDSRTAGLPAQTEELADGASQVAAGNAKIAGIGRTVATASTTLRTEMAGQRSALVNELRTAGLTEDQVARVEARLDRLDSAVMQADGTIQQASSDLDRLAGGAAQVAAGSQALADATPALTSGIHQAATGARSLRDGAGTLDAGLGRLAAGAADLQTGATRAATAGDSLADGVAQLEAGIDKLADGATKLHSELAKGRDSVPNPTDAQRKAVAATIGDPVSVSSDSMAAAGTYGAGLAPLFLSLALWIGAYTLFLLVRPFSTRALATSQRSLRTALGGWLAPVAVGLVQTLALYAVVSMGLDIRVAQPVLAVLFLGFVSLTFVAILHALAARLGAVGKFLGLVFMVVQLVSAGGTFPWQTLPAPLQAIHHVVPMTYAIDGLRRLMYGADLAPVLGDLGVLAAFLVGALAVSTVAARRARVWTPARIKPELSL